MVKLHENTEASQLENVGVAPHCELALQLKYSFANREQYEVLGRYVGVTSFHKTKDQRERSNYTYEKLLTNYFNSLPDVSEQTCRADHKVETKYLNRTDRLQTLLTYLVPQAQCYNASY